MQESLFNDIQPNDLRQPPLQQCSVVGSTVILGDCVQLMKGYADNYFDLAIVDPPYGIGVAEYDYFAFKGGIRATKGIRNKKKNWDDAVPTKDYWDELFRVSKNQIVWGANYYSNIFPVSRGWLAWDKKHPDNVSFSQFELAWTSFDKINKMFRMYPTHVAQGVKIHPTQKPIKLYDFILKHYAEKGQRILDTHLGSGNSAIAAHYFGCEFVGMEIDEDYYNAMKKRYKEKTSQIAIEGW